LAIIISYPASASGIIVFFIKIAEDKTEMERKRKNAPKIPGYAYHVCKAWYTAQNP